jgi:hypothetical protein
MKYSNAVQEATLAGHKIAAIKLLREETGMGLKEAKHAIEELEHSLGIQPSAATNSSGLAGLIKLIGFVIAAILIYRYFAA